MINVVVQLSRKILSPTLFLKVMLSHCGMKHMHMKNYLDYNIGNLQLFRNLWFKQFSSFYFKLFPVETHWLVFLFIFKPSGSKLDIFITPVKRLVFICKAHLIFTSEKFHFYKGNIMAQEAQANLTTSSALLLCSLLTQTEISHKIRLCYRSKMLFSLEVEGRPLSLLPSLCMGNTTGFRASASLISMGR